MSNKFKKPWIPAEVMQHVIVPVVAPVPVPVVVPKKCVLRVAVSTDKQGVLGSGSVVLPAMFRHGADTINSLVKKGFAEWV